VNHTNAQGWPDDDEVILGFAYHRSCFALRVKAGHPTHKDFARPHPSRWRVPPSPLGRGRSAERERATQEHHAIGAGDWGFQMLVALAWVA